MAVLDNEGVAIGEVIVLPEDESDHKICDLKPGTEYTIEMFTTILTEVGRKMSEVLSQDVETCEYCFFLLYCLFKAVF